MLLITGGTGVIGAAVVRHYASRGVSMILISRSPEKFLEEHMDATLCKTIIPLALDLRAAGAVEDFEEHLNREKWPVTATLQMARSRETLMFGKDGMVGEADFIEEYRMDVVIPYRIICGLSKLPSFTNAVLVSSMYGVVAPTPRLYDNFAAVSSVHYGVAKAAQIHLAKELAVRLAPRVRVNCVSIGGIRGRTDAAFVERYKSLNPQGKMLSPEDAVEPIDFLLSAASKDMTGANLVVDGGWSIW